MVAFGEPARPPAPVPQSGLQSCDLDERRRHLLLRELETLSGRVTAIEAELQAADDEEQRRASQRAHNEWRARIDARDERFAATLRDLLAEGVPVGMMASRLTLKKAVVEKLLAGKTTPWSLNLSERQMLRLPALVEEVRVHGVAW